MATNNRRQIVVKDVMWNKLKALSKEEGRSYSELIREALTDLFMKRSKPVSHGYNPTTDNFTK